MALDTVAIETFAIFAIARISVRSGFFVLALDTLALGATIVHSVHRGKAYVKTGYRFLVYINVYIKVTSI